MRIGVDASALATPGSGIGRYLREVLSRAIPMAGDAIQWTLHGRGGFDAALCARANVRCRDDRLPRDLGRVVAPFLQLPLHGALAPPDLFWGPAHRLPVRLPASVARVVTIHDLAWLHCPDSMRPVTRRLDALLMPRALRQADRVIACSQATREALSERFPQVRERIVAIPLAAAALPPPGPPSALEALGIAGPYVLFVGSFEPRKNLRRLLQAFAGFSPALRGSVQLVCAGADEWGGENAGDVGRELGIDERVRFVRAAGDATLSTLYAHARVLAMPSLYEGFGLPIVEAMQYGTPAVTSRLASMPEVAGDGGLLIDPLDVAALGAALQRLLGDDALREELSAKARIQAARFSWERTARTTLAVFEDARRARAGA